MWTEPQRCMNSGGSAVWGWERVLSSCWSPQRWGRLNCGVLTKGVFGFVCGISGQWAQTFISGTSPWFPDKAESCGLSALVLPVRVRRVFLQNWDVSRCRPVFFKDNAAPLLFLLEFSTYHADLHQGWGSFYKFRLALACSERDLCQLQIPIHYN